MLIRFQVGLHLVAFSTSMELLSAEYLCTCNDNYHFYHTNLLLNFQFVMPLVWLIASCCYLLRCSAKIAREEDEREQRLIEEEERRERMRREAKKRKLR